jgi:hypothetical protein
LLAAEDTNFSARSRSVGALITKKIQTPAAAI